MKLKLESHLGVTILTVTEDIPSNQVAVLKAGLAKILQSGKKNILLDLTGITQISPESLREVASLQAQAHAANATLLIASTKESIGHARSREDAMKRIRSSWYGLVAMETELKTRIDAVERRRTELRRQVAHSVGDDDEIKSLTLNNAQLRENIREIEKLVAVLLKSRRLTARPEAMQERYGSLANTLTAVLEQEGVIPVL